MTDAGARRPFRWGFLSAALVVLGLVVVGQVVGNVLAGLVARWNAPHGGFEARDAVFAAFVLCALAFAVLQRESIVRFFRTMHTGVVLVALSALAVATGVLVPQMEGFEDPDERVPSVSDLPADAFDTYLRAPARAADEFQGPRPDDHPALATLTPEQVSRAKSYRRQLDQFRFAEAYFVYHLLHPYGIGMPQAPLPDQVVAGLDRFGQRYGKEERDNREKQMKQAFGGQPKSMAITQFARDHQDGLRAFFDVATALQLNRTYKSHWFAALLWMLALGVALNTFRGRPADWLTARKAGWLVVHLGVLTLLAGGLWSKLHTNRGVLQLDLREPPQDTYWGYYDPSKPMRMPFHVKLDRFARKDWPTLEVGFTNDDFKSRLPEYTLWPGREIGMDWVTDEATKKPRPNLRLRVLQLAERAEVQAPRFWEAEQRDDPSGIGPLVELQVADPMGDAAAGDASRSLLLKPDSPRDLWYDASWAFRLKTLYGDDPELARRALDSAAADTLGWLDVGIASQGQVEPAHERIALGQSLHVGPYTITVAEATANFQLDASGKTEVRDARPLAEQAPRNPGVWVTIAKQGDALPERRLVLQGLDAQTHETLQQKYTYKEVALRLAWDAWGVAGPPRYVLQWGPTLAPRLVAESAAGDGGADRHATSLATGRALPLPGGVHVSLARLFHNARFEKTIRFLAPHVEGPHFDPDFYATDPIGLELEVTTAPGTAREQKRVVKLASTDTGLANLWQSEDTGGNDFWVRFYENQAGFPFEWRSVLSIWEDDGHGGLVPVDAGPEYEREIRVNDYFYYRPKGGWPFGGYRFFQTNADPERPTYSGIGVVYDPGIPIVLYGMYTIIVGTILAFLVRPIAQAYGKRRQEPS